MRIPLALVGLTALAGVVSGSLRTIAQAPVSATLDIDVATPGPEIPPDFYGLMTEEINHSYDGGLYAELIRNRSFQDPAPRGRQATVTPSAMPPYWSVVGAGMASVDRTDPVNAALPSSLKLELTGGQAGIANDGYWGIPIKPKTKYTASFYAKGSGTTGPVTAALVLDSGEQAVASATTGAISGGWRKYTVTLRTSATAPTTAKARFVLSASGTGSVNFTQVSLFPPTYKNSTNGLRPDLMELMAGLKPSFIRLPGGNYLEGSNFPNRFDWKKMIGPVDQRPGHMGCWGYRSSDGFGMPEYLRWCQQLNAEPILAVFAGYTLNGDHVNAGSPEMAQYTEEALQEIEYVTGPASSEWGKRRAADGFPKPFKLHYVEIGNEDWFDRSGSYDGRFTQIAKAIRVKYPNLKLIATAPVKSFKPDLYDDHFYRSARQLRVQGRQYDAPAIPWDQQRFNGGAWSGRLPDGVKTFVGEWATQEGSPTPNLNAGLADAAFLMDLERNADAVSMECYAPLLTNVNPGGSQWRTNLIGYNAMSSFGSPSYWAQVMLGQNKGNQVLPTKVSIGALPEVASPMPHGAAGLGTYHTNVEYKEFSVTTPDGKALLSAEQSQDPAGWGQPRGRWTLKDGLLSPALPDVESWTINGNSAWTDYDIRVKARKLGGREGFLVLWHAQNADTYHWWNIGGWGNTIARCEVNRTDGREPYGPSTPFVVETDRWYDLRLEVRGSRVRGFIDDKLITETTEPSSVSPPFFSASSTYARADKSVIVKVVNMGPSSVEATVNLRGISKVQPKATVTVLSGEPTAINTVAQPRNIAPKQETITVNSPSLRRTFPPHSLTVLRVRTK
ncbi:MAG: alpha-L-arabinofuranosidase C-terminal domain-containing protein [Armatimonas sp.]